MTVQVYDGVFAYRLAPYDVVGDDGFLDFSLSDMLAVNARLTPMLTNDVLLREGMTGIKVGGHLLPIPASVFSAGGALMDSGMVITHMPPSAYEPMQSGIRQGHGRAGYVKLLTYPFN
jgi:hypothetical protein